MNKKTILYTILNWGLGHATRSIPVIRALLSQGHTVIIGSAGRSLALLKNEFPQIRHVELPDYNVRYTRHYWMLIPSLLFQLPTTFYRLFQEHMKVQRLIARYNVDMIFADNRYGCFSKEIPSYFMTHQLRFQLPRGLKWSAFFSEWYNRFFFRHFKKVFIPDSGGADNLSGDLTHNSRLTQHPKVRFTGPLTSLNMDHRNVHENIDVLFLISGPEPQRTLLEQIVMQQLHDIPGKKMVILGKPNDFKNVPDQVDANTEVYPHLSRMKIMDLMRRSRLVVCRSGYSTIMELTALQKKALLIPTPGQTEQMYLAQYHKSSNQFFSQTQNGLNIKEAVRKAQSSRQTTNNQILFNRMNTILQHMGLE